MRRGRRRDEARGLRQSQRGGNDRDRVVLGSACAGEQPAARHTTIQTAADERGHSRRRWRRRALNGAPAHLPSRVPCGRSGLCAYLCSSSRARERQRAGVGCGPTAVCASACDVCGGAARSSRARCIARWARLPLCVAWPRPDTRPKTTRPRSRPPAHPPRKTNSSGTEKGMSQLWAALARNAKFRRRCGAVRLRVPPQAGSARRHTRVHPF